MFSGRIHAVHQMGIEEPLSLSLSLSLSLTLSLSLSHTRTHTHTHTQFLSHSPSLKYIIDISTFPSPQRKRSNHQQRGSRRHVLSSGYHVSPNHTAAPNLILFLTHRRAAHRTFHNCKHFQNKNTSNSEFQVETLAAF